MSKYAVFLFLILIPCTCLSNICRPHIAQAEKNIRAPKDLLYSVAIVESGRKNKATKKVEPYPWTINVNGKDTFFPTKEAAVDGVKKLQKQGVKSIDVGCMQVNLHHHKKAFKTIEDAFDPQTNVAYAAKFMGNLRKELKSWSRAVAHYHSKNRKHHIKYQRKVYHVWNEEKRQTYRTYYASLKKRPHQEVIKLRHASAKKFPAFPKKFDQRHLKKATRKA